MKTIFLEGRYTDKFLLTGEAIQQLPQKLILATTIQFFNSLDDIKKQLEDAGKQVTLFEGPHIKYPGQLLGCSINTIEGEFDAFLFIGDGKFHPMALLIKNPGKELFIYDPLHEQLRKFDQAQTEKFNKKAKASLMKFYGSDNIGIFYTTKPGQERLAKAKELQKKLQEKEKNAYLFVANDLDWHQLNNFPFIDCWVNTMCARIAYDDPVHLEAPVVEINDVL